MFIYSFISCVPVRTSFNWWIDKHAVVYPCNSILQSYKEKWTVYIWNKIDESHRLRETAVVQSLSRVQFFVPYGLQHTRLPCPSLSPRVGLDSCQLSQWCYLTISSSATLFSFCLQSFLASQTFPKSWLFTSGGQSIGASASASVLPVISFRIDWFDLLAVQGILKSLIQHHSSKASILQY